MPPKPNRPASLFNWFADTLTTENRRLAFAQAKHFSRLGILDYRELMSIGDEALLRAARSWQGKGLFSTYAVTAIKRDMVRAIRKERNKVMPQEPADELAADRWVDTIPDGHAPKPEVDLSCLTRAEATVIRRLFGIDGHAVGVHLLAAEINLRRAKRGAKPIAVRDIRAIRERALGKLREAMTGIQGDE